MWRSHSLHVRLTIAACMFGDREGAMHTIEEVDTKSCTLSQAGLGLLLEALMPLRLTVAGSVTAPQEEAHIAMEFRSLEGRGSSVIIRHAQTQTRRLLAI